MAIVSDDFRSEIAALATSAEHEIAEKRQAVKALAPKPSRVSAILWIGGLLVLLEAGVLVTQLALRDAPVAKGVRKPSPLLVEQSCGGERYRTFQALVAFRKEFGNWPETLGELVGTRIVKLPVDPATGLPLVYESDGSSFTLSCATTTAAR